MRLWSKNQEKLFFYKSKDSLSLQRLFCRTSDGRYVAYFPKGCCGVKPALKARNSLAEKFAGNWVCGILNHIFESDDLFVVPKAQVPSIGLSRRSPADIVIADVNKRVLVPEEVKLVFDVRMSVVWNWEYDAASSQVNEIGDYMTHQGRPSFTRSDNVLKAIGKGIDIRVSNFKSSKIPIIVLGNAPLSDGFCKKADYLKKAGIIQGFWSLNPFPLNNGNSRKRSPKRGFIRMNNINELETSLRRLFNQDLNFFSAMETPENLGRIIEKASHENSYENRGLKFLNLLRKS